jgi:hypothetical protein
MLHEKALLSGEPNIRIVVVPRTGTGVQRLAQYYSQVIPALMTPLTATEMQTGVYTPPPQPRIAFSGTLDQAQDFFQRQQLYMCGIPMTQWTDGSPVIIPTEQKVAWMLTGTSHAPTEIIGPITMANKIATKATPMQPMDWTATVEKVAVNAVMAGCQPEHLPIVLAEAVSGVGTGTTTFWSQWQVVSGPIVEQVGMNYDIGVWDGQNVANMCIGRAYELMAINLGGAQVGTNRMNSIGSPFNHGSCFAENGPNLPPGWIGMNQDFGYQATDSVIGAFNTDQGVVGGNFAPSAYRALQGSGTGGMADRLGVSGPPPAGTRYNWLEYLVPGLWANNGGYVNILMVPEMAMDLVLAGFPTKASVSQWLYEQSFVPMSQLKKYGWYNFVYNGGAAIEPTSGKPYASLPDTYMVSTEGPAATNGNRNLIIVVGGAEEVAEELMSQWSLKQPGITGTVVQIDPWK